MRDLMTITESTHDGWTIVQHPSPDVTGDDAHDTIEHYGATELVSKAPADPGDEFSRDILTYMNPEKTIKVVMSPSYDGGNGEHYVISVYKLAIA